MTIQDNSKSLQQLKSNFQRSINWNQPKISIEAQNQYLDYLIDPRFLSAHKLFVLSFEDNAHRTRHTRYFITAVEIKNCKIKIDGKK